MHFIKLMDNIPLMPRKVHHTRHSILQKEGWLKYSSDINSILLAFSVFRFLFFPFTEGRAAYEN